MSDYKKALRDGFEAAKKAELARKEIQAVLEKFREDVLAASEGKLLLEIKKYEVQRTPLEAINFSVFTQHEPKKTYLALTAWNPTVEKPSYKELARWKQAADGYPCVLTRNQQERQFEDRAALEEGFAELLRDPRIGETLQMLINQK